MRAVIAATMKPFAQEIVVDDVSTYVNIEQDHDTICVSAGQWDSFLAALIAAAEAKGWSKK